MVLSFGFSGIKDLFLKLEREATALNEEVTRDRFFNFVVTGYSLIDWIKNDPSVPSSAKNKQVIERLYNDRWLKICGDLATACKHFKLSKRKSITSSATSEQGFGCGRYDKGLYGIGEEAILVTLNDKTTFECQDIITGVLTTWNSFFLDHGI
jgi:hypothetical protein